MKIHIETRGKSLEKMQIFSAATGKISHAAELAMIIAELEKWKKKILELYTKKANIVMSIDKK